ncbi:MAG: S9 family peptidase [Phycisphaerales bacterium]|nr:S9 family peptidase [Phycisphaerales bacterium]
MRGYAIISSILLMLVPAAVRAEAPQRTHTIVSDDYFTLDQITTCAVSPDGGKIAYVQLRWDEAEDGRNSDIWVVDRATQATQRLTFDPAGDSDPQWSADGQWVYFLSSRKQADAEAPPYDGSQQVWRIRVDGSGLMPVTRVDDGVEHFTVSHDGDTLYFAAGHEQVADDFKALREKFDKLEYGAGVVTFSQLWKLDLGSWRSEKLIDEKRVITEFVVSPDERRIAMLTMPTNETMTNEGWSRVDVYDTSTGQTTPLKDTLWRAEAPSPYGWLESLAWTSDGSALAFGISFDGYPSEVFVADFAGGELTTQKLERMDEISIEPGRGLRWLPNTRDLLFVAEDHARARVYRVASIGKAAQGATTVATPGDVCVDSFDVSRDGATLAANVNGLTHPTDIFSYGIGNSTSSPQRITRVNPQVDTWKLPQMQLVNWTSPDGTHVEGVLELPPDYTPGTPLPMILELHGGPTAATRYCFRFWIYGRTLMPSRGFALLSPNYRGSTGYGDKFLTDLVGRKNDIDVADILAGVDAMVDRGIADPQHMGVMGWSNGGYLTNCLITTTDRFKAASSGAGIFDVIMQWSTEDTPGHVINFQQGFPWSNTQRMIAASPLFAANRITTPTLIHVGGNDTRCPPGHSRSLFRALHHYLHVPTELVVYPGEGHGLTTYEHRKAKMAWDEAWFNRYIKGEHDTDEPTPKKM